LTWHNRAYMRRRRTERVVPVAKESCLPPQVRLDPALGKPSIVVDIIGGVGASTDGTGTRQVYVPPVAAGHQFSCINRTMSTTTGTCSVAPPSSRRCLAL
jgi:hypothetical protein